MEFNVLSFKQYVLYQLSRVPSSAIATLRNRSAHRLTTNSMLLTLLLILRKHSTIIG